MRILKRDEDAGKIEKILSEFSNLNRIHSCKTVKRKTLMTHVVDDDGKECYDRQGIADIFAAFYENLYASKIPTEQVDSHTPPATATTPITPFERSELVAEIKAMKNGRAADSDGIFAEMIKFGGPNLKDALLDTFNQILSAKPPTPSAWKKTMVSVIFKKGDPGLPCNYRPISIIPVLYKLFARLLYSRLYPIIDRHQSEDQAGFRKKLSTVHHLHAFTLIQEKCHEWQQTTWVAAIDYQKAFDSVEQASIWTALTRQGVPAGYVQLLDALYKGQSAQVKTDRLSRSYAISRGTRQGDPLSSLLFNALPEDIMADVKPSWLARGMGIQMGDTIVSQMTNLRFADDLLLFGAKPQHLKVMLSDLVVAARRRGLELHPDKTKIITNATRRQRSGMRSMDVVGMQIEVLPSGASIKYLGKMITFDHSTREEIGNRIKNAWAKFHSLKDELTSRKYSLNSRMKLFDSVVSATMLYGNATWTLTKALEKEIRTTQRRMLRMVLGSGRKIVDADTGDTESWVDWLRRTTRETERRLQSLRMTEWLTRHRQNKLEWAKKLVTTDHHTWASRALLWTHDRWKFHHAQARPRRRWLDDINDLVKQVGSNLLWDQALQDPATFAKMIALVS